jgi:hypothetical protein
VATDIALRLVAAGDTRLAVHEWGDRAAVPQADVRKLQGWGQDLPVEGGPELARLVGEWLAQWT